MSTPKKRVVYMHLLDGKPAQYYEGEQIAFPNSRSGISRFAESLTQIRREQRLSDKWRVAQGWGLDFEQDYVRIQLP